MKVARQGGKASGADIFRYFPAIDHALLKETLRCRVRCRQTLALADCIIDCAGAQEPVDLLFPGDDLFTPQTRRKGLPLGNLTSQFFGNLYLDRFDHWVSEVLRLPYVRYVDDFAVFFDNESRAIEVRQQITRYLEGRRLLLHPSKTVITPVTEAQRFLGFDLLPDGRRRLANENVARFRKRPPRPEMPRVAFKAPRGIPARRLVEQQCAERARCQSQQQHAG